MATMTICSPFFTSSFQIFAYNDGVSPEPFFLQAEQSQLFQHSLKWEIIQSFNYLCQSFAGLSPVCSCLLYYGAYNWIEQRLRTTSPDLLAYFLMHARIPFTFFTARTHCCSWPTWCPPLFCRAGWDSQIMVRGFVPPQVWDFALAFTELYDVPVKLISPSYSGSSAYQLLFLVWCHQHICWESHLCHHPDHSWKHWRGLDLGYASSYCPQTLFCTADYHTLNFSAQTVFNPPHYLLIQPILHQLLYEDLMK